MSPDEPPDLPGREDVRSVPHADAGCGDVAECVLERAARAYDAHGRIAPVVQFPEQPGKKCLGPTEVAAADGVDRSNWAGVPHGKRIRWFHLHKLSRGRETLGPTIARLYLRIRSYQNEIYPHDLQSG